MQAIDNIIKNLGPSEQLIFAIILITLGYWFKNLFDSRSKYSKETMIINDLASAVQDLKEITSEFKKDIKEQRLANDRLDKRIKKHDETFIKLKEQFSELKISIKDIEEMLEEIKK